MARATRRAAATAASPGHPPSCRGHRGASSPLNVLRGYPGYPNSWFLLGKISHLEMDDDFGGTPLTQETAIWNVCTAWNACNVQNGVQCSMDCNGSPYLCSPKNGTKIVDRWHFWNTVGGVSAGASKQLSKPTSERQVNLAAIRESELGMSVLQGAQALPHKGKATNLPRTDW